MMTSFKSFCWCLCAMIVFICISGCASNLSNEIVYQASLDGIQEGEIIQAGTTRFVFVNTKGMGSMEFTWEDSTGVIVDKAKESALNYLVPSLEGDNYLRVTVSSGRDSIPIVRTIKFTVILPPSTPTSTPLPVSITSTVPSFLTNTPKPTITLIPTVRPLETITYNVKVNDTLSGVSRNLFGSISYTDEIAKTNCLKNSVIFPDQELQIKYYTVQFNDALSVIAERYSSSLDQLIEINDSIQDGWLIRPGDLIFFPTKKCE